MNITSEIGIGNEWFLTTHFKLHGSEMKINQFFIPTRIDSVFLKLQIFRYHLMLDFFNGIIVTKKSKHSFKVIFGLGGTRHKIWGY